MKQSAYGRKTSEVPVYPIKGLWLSEQVPYIHQKISCVPKITILKRPKKKNTGIEWKKIEYHFNTCWVL